MPRRRRKFHQRGHFNPEDTAEPTAGPSHGQVVGVEGTAATSGNEPTASKRTKESVTNEKTSDVTSGNQKPSRKPKFDFASSRFSDIKTTDHFIDKTKIIEVLFDDSPMVLLTRPRRFGKTTIMNMVKEFVEKKVYTSGEKVGQEIPRTPENDRAFPKMNLLLFDDENLKISKWDKFLQHRGKYPTIHVDFLDVQGDDYLKILFKFRDAITKAFCNHSYLLDCEGLWKSENQPRAKRFNKERFEEYLNPTLTQAELTRTLMKENSAERDRTERSVESTLSSHIEDALSFLAEVLHRHFGHGIYLLIDEYDSPINSTIFMSKEHCRKMNNVLTSLFKNLLKKNQNEGVVVRALITGISYLGSVGLSGANNLQKHMFLRGEEDGDDRYEEFYGVTDEELQQLTAKFVKEFWQGVNKLPEDKVSSYYNGYKSTGNSGVKIYPIWSIVHALRSGKLKHYWESSGIMVKAREGLNIPIVLFEIEKMLQEKTIKCEILHRLELEDLEELSDVILKRGEMTLVKPDLYFSFLIQQGYLMYKKALEEEDTFEVGIPNELLKNEFRKLMKKHFGKNYDDLITKVAAVFNDFPEDPNHVNDDIMKRLIRPIEKVFLCVSKKWNHANEDAYHCVIFHCLCKSRFMSSTEMQGNKARLDIAFNSEKIAVIIEMKYCKNPLEAVDQIEREGYVNLVREKLSRPKFKCVIMGLNVDKNNKVRIAYKNADKRGPGREVFLKNGD